MYNSTNYLFFGTQTHFTDTKNLLRNDKIYGHRAEMSSTNFPGGEREVEIQTFTLTIRDAVVEDTLNTFGCTSIYIDDTMSVHMPKELAAISMDIQGKKKVSNRISYTLNVYNIPIIGITSRNSIFSDKVS